MTPAAAATWRDPSKVPGFRHEWTHFDRYYDPEEGKRYTLEDFLRDLRVQLREAGLEEAERDRVVAWAEYRAGKVLEHRATPVTDLPTMALRKKTGELLEGARDLQGIVTRLTEGVEGRR